MLFESRITQDSHEGSCRACVLRNTTTNGRCFGVHRSASIYHLGINPSRFDLSYLNQLQALAKASADTTAQRRTGLVSEKTRGCFCGDESWNSIP